ncbi:hypothetical protein M0804_005049 [Polistes exclamans]|nr:hypothetical protein M0804_005049 [Polistes exclamans]
MHRPEMARVVHPASPEVMHIRTNTTTIIVIMGAHASAFVKSELLPCKCKRIETAIATTITTIIVVVIVVVVVVVILVIVVVVVVEKGRCRSLDSTNVYEEQTAGSDGGGGGGGGDGRGTTGL